MQVASLAVNPNQFKSKSTSAPAINKLALEVMINVQKFEQLFWNDLLSVSGSVHAPEAKLSVGAGVMMSLLLAAVAVLDCLILLDQSETLWWKSHIVMVMTATMVATATGGLVWTWLS